MADSLNDHDFEAKMIKTRDLLDALKKTQAIFNNTFQTMRPKERAEIVREIQANHKTIGEFITSAKKYNLRTTAMKFGLENIRQKFQMAMALWRRTEKLLESTASMSAVPTKTTVQGSDNQSNTDSVVDQYVSALERLGHKASDDVIQEFKDRLESAYSKAKQKTGRDLAVHVVEENGKIKVRMEPK